MAIAISALFIYVRLAHSFTMNTARTHFILHELSFIHSRHLSGHRVKSSLLGSEDYRQSQRCTCKMAPENDSSAVVDERLRDHKVGKLRVIDASM